MERRNVDPRRNVRLQRVRRRLFADDNDEGDESNRRSSGVNDNVVNCLFEEVRRDRENAKNRWNFDFENEVPLPGCYEWVKLDRDGNEISDSMQSNNGVQNSREERSEEAESDTKETGKTENDDEQPRMRDDKK